MDEIDKVTKVLSILEQSTLMISEGRIDDLNFKYIQNATLPERIKHIICTIKALVPVGEADESLLMVALSKFKDSLIVGDKQGLNQVCQNAALPNYFRITLSEMKLQFESVTEHLNTMLEDVFFYADIVSAILQDKHVTKEELDSKDNISQEKRKTAWLLLLKIEQLRQGCPLIPKREQSEKYEEQLLILKSKLVQVEKRYQQDQAKLSEKLKDSYSRQLEYQDKLRQMQNRLKEGEAELDEAKRQIEDLVAQLAKARNTSVIKEVRMQEELGQLKKESQLLQSSLARKQQASGNLISSIQKLENQLEDKNKQLTLFKNQNKALENKLKISQQEREQRNQEIYFFKEKLTSYKIQIEKADKLANQRQSQLQNQLSESKQIIKRNEEIIKRLQEQNLQLKGNRNQANHELVERAAAFLESAQRFSQIYSNSNRSMNRSLFQSRQQSKISLSRSVSIQQREVVQVQVDTYLKNIMNSSIFSKLLAELPSLPFAELIYKFPEERNTQFHQRLKGKNHLLLLCKAENGALIGGFAPSGFTDSPPKESTFIFCAKEDKLIILRLKQGKKGVVPDKEFLIFGNQQLSLQQNCDYATSFFTHSLKTLNFEGSLQDRQRFLELAGNLLPNNRIPLFSYDIISLKASK